MVLDGDYSYVFTRRFVEADLSSSNLILTWRPFETRQLMQYRCLLEEIRYVNTCKVLCYALDLLEDVVKAFWNSGVWTKIT